MKSVIYRIAYPFFKAYWFIRRPRTYGVKVILRNKNEILFVRHSYGSRKWNFPGGGIDRGETPKQAVIRETREELGVTPQALKTLGSFATTLEYKLDTIHVFEAWGDREIVQIDGAELIDSRWFLVDQLPSEMSTIASLCLNLFKA